METNKPHSDCCPSFEPEPWNEKTHIWQEKRFIKDKVFTFFYMPVNFGSAMRRLFGKVEAAGAQVPDYLCLSDHTSKWNMDLYLAVDRDVLAAENKTISGKYISKAYEGPFKDSGKWMKDFSNFLKEKNLKTSKNFMWYTTCPKCAKIYGKNWVVAFAEVL